MTLLSLLLACSSAPAPTAPPPPPPDAAPAPPARRAAPAAPVTVKPAERDPRWADARCNDGTPFAYVYRPGASRTWVVNLSGGFYCDETTAPCSARERRLTTTLRDPDGGHGAKLRDEGVFATSPRINPTFHDAHQVDAHYCSSDLWLGASTERRPTTGSPEGWYFSGRHNLRALTEALPALHGLDPTTDRVLLVGTSAGGLGLAATLDLFRDAWPELVADGRLKVVLDGSWIVRMPDADVPDLDHWGPLHPACTARLEAAGRDPVACAAGPEVWPDLVATGIPVLVQISGLDTPQVRLFGVQGADAEALWRQELQASLAPVPWVWSRAQSYHTVAYHPLFAKGPQGRTFRDALDRFWRGEAPEAVWLGYEATPSP